MTGQAEEHSVVGLTDLPQYTKNLPLDSLRIVRQTSNQPRS